MTTDNRLLGGLPFVSRTFEGTFKENPYVLDMDANLYIGPADHVPRDEHASIEVIYHFLRERGKITHSFRDLLRNRRFLLEAFAEFDEARAEGVENEFRIFVFGTYDGEPLTPNFDDELPAGPCGTPINDIKRRFYQICQRMDQRFDKRELTDSMREIEENFVLK